MRKRYLFLLGLVLLLFTLYSFLTNPIRTPEKVTDHNIEVSAERLKNHVLALAETPKPRNYINLNSLDSAATYIQNKFIEVGLQTSIQEYKVQNTTYKNVIASYGPEDGERIIIGAHYDVCGEQQGADDNASGIAGLLEIAYQLQKLKPKLSYRIDFVAYTLEEPPFFRTEFMGSYIHAKSLADNKIKVKAMFCLEMIGYYTDEEDSQSYPIDALEAIYPSTGNFIALVGELGKGKHIRQVKRNMSKVSEVPVVSINAPASLPGIDFSDHLNYWHFGFESMMITDTSFYRNKNYHQKTDTPDTLDYPKMAEVVKGITYAIINFK